MPATAARRAYDDDPSTWMRSFRSAPSGDAPIPIQTAEGIGSRGAKDRQFSQESSHGFRLDPADTTLHTTQAPRSGCRQV